MRKTFALFLLFFSFAAPAKAYDVFSLAEGHYSGMTDKLKADIGGFESSFESADAKNFAPVEARVGLFFIRALSYVTEAIFGVLRPFLNIFIIALFAFWLVMESWQMMRSTDGKNNDYWDFLTRRAVKKTAKIAICLWILNHEPATLFMMLTAPVISLGTGMSDLILNGTAEFAGTKLPDTCAAIHGLVGDGAGLAIGKHAADLLCMPTRLAGFFYTFIQTGFGWMKEGLGFGGSGLTFFLGLIFVILFVYNLWKFALAALGVIVDLFFVLLFLPFTAVRECFSDKDKDTKYEGIFRPLFDGLAGLVQGVGAAEQFRKFVNAIIYFVVLSVVSAISIAILSKSDPMTKDNFMGVLIMGCLISYLINKADKLAEDLGGKIDDSFGKSVSNVVVGAGKNIVDWGKNAGKALFSKAP